MASGVVDSSSQAGVRVLAAIAADGDDNVLKVAWARATTRGLCLTVLSVVDDVNEQGAVRDRLATRARALLHNDSVIDVEVRSGDRAEQILASIDERPTALVVIGEAEQRDGLLGRIFWPSVTTRVARGASCPVLVARYTPGTGRTLVASALDEGLPVLRAAADESHAGAQVTVLHCIEPAPMVTSYDIIVAATNLTGEHVDAATARLQAVVGELGLERADLRVEVATPANRILGLAKELAVDLIIVGTHGRSGMARILMGSVAEQVVRDAPCSVLVVRIE